MTLVIALKVGDGAVLGADSATVVGDRSGNYLNSFFNAEKLFNLAEHLPIGAVTYGVGTLSGHSIGHLAKDLRTRVSDQGSTNWYLDPATFTVALAAEKIAKYFYDELYSQAFKPNPQAPPLGFLVAGYSANATSPEVWRIKVNQGKCPGPEVIYDESSGGGAAWEGQAEACHRLLLGYSPEITDRLVAAGMSKADAKRLLRSAQPLVTPTMPIQDAIDLVRYLVEMTAEFVRFIPGLLTVAKPFDLAAITRHEGFRWVARKHYYPRELNLAHP